MLRLCCDNTAFTLVELLIVVILLAILAAVVIPQFGGAIEESEEATLLANLTTIRKSIERYKLQHNDAYPDILIIAQLATATDVDGSPGTEYGPYVRAPFPDNPINGSNSVMTVATMIAAPDETTGWIYATGDGEFRANVSGLGRGGKAYFDL